MLGQAKGSLVTKPPLFLETFLEGITNIFSFKGYARKRNSNYFRKR